MAMPAQALVTAPIPPQNLDAEESVLGAMMLSPLAIGAVTESSNLSAGDFYRESHGQIYRAILALYAKGEPVDAITVVDELDRTQALEAAGGAERVHELAALVPAASNAAHYARIVDEMSTLRGLIRAGNDIARLGFDRPGETVELVDRAESIVFNLSQQRVSSEFAHIDDLLKDSFETITKLYEAGSDITGTPSGYRDLDRLTSGFQPGNLVIVAARPSMGKSALALCMAANVAVRHGTPVALFTLEMSKMEVTQRLMCAEGKVESQRLRTGKLAVDDWPRLTSACDKLAKAPIYVDDTGSITMMEIRSKLRRLKMKAPELGLVIVDYLQLMTSGTTVENRVQEVSQISRALKVLARDLEVPIVALSQLSRAVEQRHDKRPILSDLRESGCLSGETRVYLPDHGVYRPIRELVGSSGFRVLAVNTESWRLEPRTVTRSFATGVKPVYRLTTRLGHAIRATGNHKFLAFDGWRRLDDLAKGMRIAVPRTLSDAGRRETMSDTELALLGHLIGDGCTLPRHAIQYTSKDEDLAELVARLARDVFGATVRPRVSRERTWFQTYLPAAGRLTPRRRNPVSAWLAGLGAFGLRAPEKHVPERIFEQPAQKIGVFLRHLWATDGCVAPGRGRGYPVVRYDSTSERLTRDVQSLLLRLGIVSSRRAVSMGAKGLPSHRLTVSGRADVERFLDLVGGVGSRKASACAEIRRQFADVTPNPTRDTIPSSAWRTAVVRAMAPAGVTARPQALSRQRASPVAERVRSAQLSALATNEIYWDEVVSIEPDGVEEVYDLTVDGLHSFVAEDVIVHNSIEQDADLVMFVYRDEYYNPEDTESAGIAELILAKHRNGATGLEKLAFQKRYAKFADLAAAS
jgi:replicative DNA helicase